MATSKPKNLSPDEIKAAKRNKRIVILVIVLVAVAAPLIWFSMEYFAPVSLLSQAHISVDGKERILKFSEKSNEQRYQDHQNSWEERNVHYAYYLELVDSITKTSLDKIKFKAPVHNIQNTPQMIVLNDGTIWLVSTTPVADRDRPGFILKFHVKADKISKDDYVLDEKYTPRDVIDHKVYLSDGKGVYSANNPVFGSLSLDLETGKITDDRKN